MSVVVGGQLRDIRRRKLGKHTRRKYAFIGVRSAGIEDATGGLCEKRKWEARTVLEDNVKRWDDMGRLSILDHLVSDPFSYSFCSFFYQSVSFSFPFYLSPARLEDTNESQPIYRIVPEVHRAISNFTFYLSSYLSSCLSSCLSSYLSSYLPSCGLLPLFFLYFIVLVVHSVLPRRKDSSREAIGNRQFSTIGRAKRNK